MMNWKPPLIGFVAGCIVTSIGTEMSTQPRDPIVLHTLEVKTVDSETKLPIAVTGIRYPKHPDFSFSTAKPEMSMLHIVYYGTESRATRIVWVGRGRAEEYRFTLSSEGYEDIAVPTEFIKTTSGSLSGIQEDANLLPMKKSKSGGIGD